MRVRRPARSRALVKARRTVHAGVEFASAKEARHYALLLQRQKRGQITGLEVQPAFPIVIDEKQVRCLPDKNGRQGRPMVYHADFMYVEGGTRRVIEVKGYDTPGSRIRRALVQHIYGIEIEVV